MKFIAHLVAIILSAQSLLPSWKSFVATGFNWKFVRGEHQVRYGFSFCALQMQILLVLSLTFLEQLPSYLSPSSYLF